jgi:hypothetical protein
VCSVILVMAWNVTPLARDAAHDEDSQKSSELMNCWEASDGGSLKHVSN